MRRLRFLLLLSVLLSMSYACAQERSFFKDGNALLPALNSDRSSSQYVRAAGYIIGVADALNEERTLATKQCFITPRNVTQGQLIDIVRLHLEQNPATRDLPAPWIIGFALQRAYPCPPA